MINEKMVNYGTERSKIRELFEYGKELSKKIGAENVYDFTLGNPSSPCPEKVLKTLNKISKIPENHAYTSSVGDLETRKAICSYNESKYFFTLLPELIYMTCGAAASLTITLKSIISNPNEKVIVLSPFFPEYKVFITNAGAKTVEVLPNFNDFSIDFNDFLNKLDNDVQAVIINSPNNPTGVIYSEDTIIKLSNILKEKEKEFGHAIYLIADEPYREIVFDNEVCPFIPKYYDDTIITYSYSKSLSLPGDRIGYIAVSPNATDSKKLFASICGAGRSMGFVCAPSVFQKLLISAVGTVADFSVYEKNRNILYENLTKFGYEVVYPKGAFYLFVKAPLNDDERFCEFAKTYGVLVVPSKSFGVSGYFRVATCVKESTVVKSLPIFEKIIKEYK